jgi:Holliday junction resolvasome RuvABC endonuclease subunit
MNILALDLGTKTGYALSARRDQISGTENFKQSRFQGGGMIYLHFRAWLRGMLKKYEIDVVYFEEVRRHIGTDAAHMYGGYLAHLSELCEELSVPYQGVPVGTIKRHITGKGNAGKNDVIKAVKKKGFNPKDDNEADALAILDYAKKEMKDV